MKVYTIAKKKLKAAVCAALVVSVLTACSLATEEGNRIFGGDRLVGIFVTTEYLDTFDWSSLDGSAPAVGTVTGSNDKKIYGTFDQEKSEYVFKGLEGYSLGTVYVKTADDDQQQDYICSIFSDCMMNVNFNIGDTGNTCTGILCYDRTQIGSEYELTLYANPVYQTEDGQIYLVSENGGVMVNGTEGDFITSISDTMTVTENGKKNETKNMIEVTYRGAVPVRSLKFSWYDKDGNVREESSFQAEKIPESIRWGEDTAYILVTMERTDGTADYELIGPEHENYQVYLPSDSLILESKTMEVKR